MGTLTAGGGVLSFAIGVAVLYSIAENGLDEDKVAELVTLLLAIPLSMLCAQIAWRLWMGPGRKRTRSLPSRLMYVVSGLALLGLLAALLAGAHPPSAFRIGTLAVAALGLFGMAAAQRRTS